MERNSDKSQEKDPDEILFKAISALTYVLTLGVMGTIIFRFYLQKVHLPLYQILLPITLMLIIMTLWCHYVSSTIDPGFVSISPLYDHDLIPLDNQQVERCKKCNALRNHQDIHHCSHCRRCVYKMDHHCAWINNCVGYFTYKPFILFNFYLTLLTMIGSYVVTYNVIMETKIQTLTTESGSWLNPLTIMKLKSPLMYILNPNSTVDFVLFYTIVGFCVFGGMMLVKTLMIIASNTTHIDELKGIAKQKLQFGISETKMVDQNNTNYNHLFKIVLVGDAGVGKTHLLNRYVKGKLPQNKPSTIGVEFATKNVELKNGGGVVKAQIWDTAGQERYRAITSAHYRRALGALVVYDVTKLETFINAKKWLEELKASAEPECVIYLVGNQVDKVEMNPSLRQVTQEQVQAFAKQYQLHWEETSALTNAKVTDVFDHLLNLIYEVKQKQELNDEGSNGMEGRKYSKLHQDMNTDQGKKQKKGCC